MTDEGDELDALRAMRFPPTGEAGDVDLSIIDYNLSLTYAERLRQHDAALSFVRALQKAMGTESEWDFVMDRT